MPDTLHTLHDSHARHTRQAPMPAARLLCHISRTHTVPVPTGSCMPDLPHLPTRHAPMPAACLICHISHVHMVPMATA